MPPPTTPSVLGGLRVLDVSTLFPAGLLAAMLGDLGADVVKVESAGGDPLRSLGAPVWALAARNKRSVRIDLDTVAGVELLGELAAVTDVVVVNQPHAVLARWGCTYDEVAARNPGVVMVAVSGWGATGPYRDRPGNGTTAEAFAGLTHLTGEPDGPPLLASVPIGDGVGALAGVSGVLGALYWRDARGGAGQLVDVSLYEPVLGLLGPALARMGAPGSSATPRRTGSRIAGATPRNVYATADGRFVAVSAGTDAQVARVLDLIGHDDPGAGARFLRAADRAAHADELDALVAAWVAARPAAKVVDAFVAARLPAAPVNDLSELARDPHARARESVVSVEDAQLGPVAMPAPGPRLAKTPARMRGPGPALGAHTEDVTREWLGEPR